MIRVGLKSSNFFVNESPTSYGASPPQLSGTSVPSLTAKPIIDIDVLSEDRSLSIAI
jgi:hypothetical protein